MKIDEDLKARLKEIAPETLEQHGVLTLANDNKSYTCPKCDNGTTGKDGDGMKPNFKNGAWLYNCFRCGEGYDNIALLAAYYGLGTSDKDFVEVCKRAANDFLGYNFDIYGNSDFAAYHGLTQLKRKKFDIVERAKTTSELEFEKAYADNVKQDLSGLDNLSSLPVVDRRGLTVQTLRYFGCRYVKNWLHPKTRAEGNPRHARPSRRILIPSIDNSHYVAVLVDSDRTPENKKYWKMHTSGKAAVIGLQTIKRLTERIFVFEGEFDCMTAYQSYKQTNFLRGSMAIFGADSAVKLDDNNNPTGSVTCDEIPLSAFIATGGAAETNWINEVDNKCKRLGIKPKIIVQLDADKAGTAGADKIQKVLRQRGYIAVIRFIKQEFK